MNKPMKAAIAELFTPKPACCCQYCGACRGPNPPCCCETCGKCHGQPIGVYYPVWQPSVYQWNTDNITCSRTEPSLE